MRRVLAVLLLLAGCGAGKFDRDRMDKIVERTRPLVTEPGRLYEFRVSDDLDASTLAPVAANAMRGRGDGRGFVRASIDAKRHLAVSIETRDEGHAGEWGFIFVDEGFAKADLEGVQLDSQHEERIDARWRSWHYDLD